MSKLIDAGSSPIIIPIVLPRSGDASSGRVRNLPVCPQAMPRMLERRNSEYGYGVRGVYADKGVALLRDIYLEEDLAAKWSKYVRYLAAWAKGETRSPFPFADLPLEVQRRQTEPMANDEFSDDFAFSPKATTGAAHPLPAARKPKPEAQQ